MGIHLTIQYLNIYLSYFINLITGTYQSDKYYL